jgi:hypothetical protein
MLLVECAGEGCREAGLTLTPRDQVPAGFFAIYPAAFWAAAFWALTAAHLFLVASTMRLRPAALSLRFFGGAELVRLYAAQRFLWAAPMRARADADSGRLVRTGLAAVLIVPPSLWRISLIFWSMSAN